MEQHVSICQGATLVHVLLDSLVFTVATDPTLAPVAHLRNCVAMDSVWTLHQAPLPSLASVMRAGPLVLGLLHAIR